MKRIILYLGILAAVCWAGNPGTDIGMLIPVETVFIQKLENGIVMETDSGDRGVGLTVRQAAVDLERKADGVIYLDTADYLIVNKEAEVLLYHLQKNQKQEVSLCETEAQIDVQEVTPYLRAHKPQLTLGRWSNDVELPKLEEEEGNFKMK